MKTIKEITNVELITAHRNGLVSNGEFVDEAVERGWPEWRIQVAAMCNFTMRQQGDVYDVH